MWHVTALVAFPYSIKGLRDTVACDQMTTGGNHLGRERGLDKQCAPEAREEGERGRHQDRNSLPETQGKGKGKMAPWTEQESKWLRSCPEGTYDQPSLGTAPTTAAVSIPSP